MSDIAWRRRPFHRTWLMQQANALFDFQQFSAINPQGGFFELDHAGLPAGDVRQIHSTSRMIHCFAIGHLLGRPGADAIVDHGMNFLWQRHRDHKHGGYFWSLDDNGVRESSKQAYGHAFVLLAAVAAKTIGHPLADGLLADITGILESRFWEREHGAVAEEFAEDWSEISSYRGQNSNMHLAEALMAAFEVTGEKDYLLKTESIADLVVRRHATALGGRVAEHFDRHWNFDSNYRGSEIFRPSGTTPGHWFEWSRLLLQLWQLGGRTLSWIPDAAVGLFRNAIDFGWDTQYGGFFYTLDWNNRPVLRGKLWWPTCEAIGAAAFLSTHFGDPYHEQWYRRLWGLCNNHFIDHRLGGWQHELGEALQPRHELFNGKPDIYHALQACLIPLFPATGSLTRVICEAGGRLEL